MNFPHVETWLHRIKSELKARVVCRIVRSHFIYS